MVLFLYRFIIPLNYLEIWHTNNWVTTWENVPSDMWTQRTEMYLRVRAVWPESSFPNEETLQFWLFKLRLVMILICQCECCSHISEGITQTYLYNSDPHKSHFYMVKLGFKGVYIINPVLTSTHNLRFEQKCEKYKSFFYLKVFSFWRWTFLYIWIGVFS